jgi:hypothetical protein
MRLIVNFGQIAKRSGQVAIFSICLLCYSGSDQKVDTEVRTAEYIYSEFLVTTATHDHMRPLQTIL